MREPLQITYRRIQPSDGIEDCVRGHLRSLEARYRDIIRCDVLIEQRATGTSRDDGLHIHLGVGVPGRELGVDREAPGPQSRQHLVDALHDAFAEIEWRLKRYGRRNDAPPEASLPGRGIVSELFTQRDYGIISTTDGSEVYFRRKQVLDDAFDRLEIGSLVEFSVAPALLGAQAVSVRLLG